MFDAFGVGKKRYQQRLDDENAALGQDARLKTRSQRAEVEVFDGRMLRGSLAEGDLPDVLALVEVDGRD